MIIIIVTFISDSTGPEERESGSALVYSLFVLIPLILVVVVVIAVMYVKKLACFNVKKDTRLILYFIFIFNY